jgi:hypothetical protein
VATRGRGRGASFRGDGTILVAVSMGLFALASGDLLAGLCRAVLSGIGLGGSAPSLSPSWRTP